MNKRLVGKWLTGAAVALLVFTLAGLRIGYDDGFKAGKEESETKLDVGYATEMFRTAAMIAGVKMDSTTVGVQPATYSIDIEGEPSHDEKHKYYIDGVYECSLAHILDEKGGECRILRVKKDGTRYAPGVAMTIDTITRVIDDEHFPIWVPKKDVVKIRPEFLVTDLGWEIKNLRERLEKLEAWYNEETTTTINGADVMETTIYNPSQEELNRQEGQ